MAKKLLVVDANIISHALTLDCCTYHEAGVSGLGKVKVVYGFKTDHYPGVASWKLDSPDR